MVARGIFIWGYSSGVWD